MRALTTSHLSHHRSCAKPWFHRRHKGIPDLIGQLLADVRDDLERFLILLVVSGVAIFPIAVVVAIVVVIAVEVMLIVLFDLVRIDRGAGFAQPLKRAFTPHPVFAVRFEPTIIGDRFQEVGI